LKGVREGDIFVKGEGVGSNRTGDVKDNEEFIFLADIGGVKLEKVRGFGWD
jgi:hypothetical protein